MKNDRKLLAYGAVQMYFWGLDGKIAIDGIDIIVTTTDNHTTIAVETPKYGVHYSSRILHTECQRKFIKEISDFCDTVDDKRSEILQTEADYEITQFESYVDSQISEMKINRMS
jgi:hypothetical protein